MPNFRYNALTATGDPVSGELVGPDADFIIQRLLDQALLPIDAVPSAAASDSWSLTLSRDGFLAGRELALTSQQLARLLKAGLPLDRALGILIDLVEGRRMARILRQTLERVRDGMALADALAAQDAFPQTFISLVRAGEASGALQAVLDRLAEFLVRSEAMRQKVVSALIYPVILILAAAGSVGLVLTAVLPQFEPMFRDAGAQLPASTRIVMAAGDALRAYWWIGLLGVAAAAISWKLLLRNPIVATERDRLLLRLPLVRVLVSRLEVARFCRTLGVMLGNGVAAPAALALCSATIGNRVIAAAIEDAATRFKEGEGLSAPLARTGRFPNLSIQMIRIGEETGKLDDMLLEVAEIYDGDVQRALERLLAMLVPALTIATGLLIAFIIGAVMTALISVNELAG